MSISWFLSRRCILRSLGVNARTDLVSLFSSVVSFSNTFAIAGLSLCSLGRSLNRTCGKNRNDLHMTGAINGLNWAKTMRYVGHHCLVPGQCGLSGSPCLPGSPLVSDTSPKYIDREGLRKRRKSKASPDAYPDAYRQRWKSIVGDHTNAEERKQYGP